MARGDGGDCPSVRGPASSVGSLLQHPSRAILHRWDMPSALPKRSFPTGGVTGVNLPGEFDLLMVQLEAVLDLSDTSTRNGGLP